MCTHWTAPISSILFLGLLCMQAPAPAQEKKPAPDKGFVLEDAGFATPESVLYDAQADLYLVSNINGSPARKDDNGFISRVSPEGKVLALRWIDGRKEGVELHAPKGMALLGKRLYVADIDTVRVFDRAAGKEMEAIPVPGGRFLNDLCATEDGRLLVTDSAGAGIFRIDPGTGKASPVFKRRTPARPNGICAAGGKVYVAASGEGAVWCMGKDGKVEHRWKVPGIGLDGLVFLPEGALLVSSWRACAVFRITPDGTASEIFSNLTAPADIGFDGKRRRVLIPWFTKNRVEARPLPAAGEGKKGDGKGKDRVNDPPSGGAGGAPGGREPLP